MNKITRIFKNPLFIVLPVVALLLVAWHQYTSAESEINVSRANILPNGGFDTLDDRGHPVGWGFSPASSAVTATTIAGYESPKLLVLTNSSDTPRLSTTLTSPLVGVENGSSYFYKGFYTSTIPFDLVLRENYKNGTKKLSIIKRYTAGKQWATVSHLFTPGQDVQSIQFIYSFWEKGEMRLDNNYLEANPQNVYVPPEMALGRNLIPALASGNSTAQPANWSSYSSGSNTTTPSYVSSSDGTYLRSIVSQYVDGEAKWQYPEIPVRGNQAFSFSVSYRSDSLTDVVAEYLLASGKRQFYTLATLQPAKEWTTYSGRFEVPSSTVSTMVTPVLHGSGALDTKDYTLYDVSKTGTKAWQRPLVSITFDDGWESAYVNGLPLLDTYNYKATFYLNPAAVDTFGFVNSDQVAALKQQGHELASHGYEHLNFTTLNTPSIDYQLRHANEYFKQIHNQQSTQFSTPFGGTDSQVEHYARSYYSSLRTTESGLNTRQNFNPYNLRILYVGKDTPRSKLASALDEAKASNGWLILVYHRVDSDTSGEPVISPAQFHEQLTTLKESKITVTTVTAAMQEIGKQP